MRLIPIANFPPFALLQFWLPRAARVEELFINTEEIYTFCMMARIMNGRIN
jgi:hypothetical protein